MVLLLLLLLNLMQGGSSRLARSLTPSQTDHHKQRMDCFQKLQPAYEPPILGGPLIPATPSLTLPYPSLRL